MTNETKNLAQGYLPIMAVVGIVAAFFWAGFGYAKLITTSDSTDARVTIISAALEEQKIAIKELSGQISDLKRSVISIPADALRKEHLTAMMAGFCLRFERMNKGIRCPAEM